MSANYCPTSCRKNKNCVRSACNRKRETSGDARANERSHCGASWSPPWRAAAVAVACAPRRTIGALKIVRARADARDDERRARFELAARARNAAACRRLMAGARRCRSRRRRRRHSCSRAAPSRLVARLHTHFDGSTSGNARYVTSIESAAMAAAAATKPTRRKRATARLQRPTQRENAARCRRRRRRRRRRRCRRRCAAAQFARISRNYRRLAGRTNELFSLSLPPRLPPLHSGDSGNEQVDPQKSETTSFDGDVSRRSAGGDRRADWRASDWRDE